jgi:hypothetical protein
MRSILRSIILIALAVLTLIAVGIGALAASGQGHVARSSSPTRTETASDGGGGSTRSVAGSGSGFCSEIGTLTAARLERVVDLPENHPSFVFPAEVRIDAADARAIARSLCALPAAPRGVFSCPMDAGIHYNLVFVAAGSAAVVTIDPWGCEFTSGVLSPRWAARSAGGSMWRTLGSAIGLHDATSTTFAGTLHGNA